MRSEWNLIIIGFAFVAISIASIGKHSFRIFVENKISVNRDFPMAVFCCASFLPCGSAI